MASSSTLSPIIATALHLIPDNSTRILDIGCKTANILSYLRERFSKELIEIIGIESLDSQVKNISDGYIRRFEVKFEDIAELPFPHGYFDCILCLDMLQKMVNPDHFLSVLLKPYLSPGGTLILTLPNILHNSFLLNLLCKGRFEGSLVTNDSNDLRFFSIFESIELLMRNGFEVDSKIYCTVSPEDPKTAEFYSDLSTLIGSNNGTNYELLSRIVYFVLLCRKANSLATVQPILWNNYTFFTSIDDSGAEVHLA